MNECPHLIFSAFFCASVTSSGSLPSVRIKHGPLASQNAIPNLIPGQKANLILLRMRIFH